ncbi:MAG: response regulator [Bacteroidota bacterium]
MLVFLVDDDFIFNTLNTAVINRFSNEIQIRSFLSGVEMLNFIKQSGNDFVAPEILLLDVWMPEMNGFEFLDELLLMDKNPLSTTKIYLHSSTLNELDLKKANEYSNLSGWLDKPLTVELFSSISI